MRSPRAAFLLRVGVREDRLSDYVRDVPAVRALVGGPLSLHPHVTFLVGENGSGKSTLIEAIAVPPTSTPKEAAGSGSERAPRTRACTRR